MSLADRKTPQVAVLGVGQSRIGFDRTEVSLQELIFESANATFADAGITRAEIDSVVLACSDLSEGRSIGSMTTAAAAGAYMKHEIRTTNDGLYGVVLGALEILAGNSRVVHVASWTKLSEGDWANASPASAEPFYDRPVGLRDVTALGLAACELQAGDPMARDRADRLVARYRVNAARNPRASQVANGRAATAVNTPLIAWPLRAGDLPSASDGAFGMILTDLDFARASGKPFALLKAIHWGESSPIGSRTATGATGLPQVAARAYRQAGITQSIDVDLIELVARSSYEEVALLADLIAPLGLAADAISPADARAGPITVNPSGGSWGTYAMQSAGLLAASEVVRQLTDRAGPTQVSSARIGIAHGQSGFAAQGNVVAVFGREES